MDITSMEEEFGADVVSVLDEDGVEHQFELLDTMETEKGTFVALTPYSEEEDGEEEAGELIVLQVVEDNGEEVLMPIEDEKLFMEMATMFEERLNEFYDFEEEDGAEETE